MSALMAALPDFADPEYALSPFNLPDLFSDSSDDSPEPFAGGQSDLDVYDYMQFEEALFLDDAFFTFPLEPEEPAPPVLSANANAGQGSAEGHRMNGETKRRRVEAEFRIGFKTKSDVEIMDDGFKWRKYGKKAVKNSPNPRNYYRCSSSGCGVKKRVERDRGDHRYVITIYEGTHNHESPDGGNLPFISCEFEANSSVWASCGQTFTDFTQGFTCNFQFAPPS